jgi:hypothetical protein
MHELGFMRHRCLLSRDIGRMYSASSASTTCIRGRGYVSSFRVRTYPRSQFIVVSFLTESLAEGVEILNALCCL